MCVYVCACTCVLISGVTSKAETLNYLFNFYYTHKHNVAHEAIVHYKACLLVAVNLQKNKRI